MHIVGTEKICLQNIYFVDFTFNNCVNNFFNNCAAQILANIFFQSTSDDDFENQSIIIVMEGHCHMRQPGLIIHFILHIFVVATKHSLFIMNN